MERHRNIMLKVALHLPLSLYHAAQVWLFPRRLFIATYKPSTEHQRECSQYINNNLRRAAYKLTR